MRWEKLGQVYKVKSEHPLAISHASNPLPVLIGGNIYRVFFSCRDIDNKSSVSYVDFDISTLKVIYVHREPVFIYGDANSFYSHGVSIGNCYSSNNKNYILFMGWQVPDGQHWRGDIGRLHLENNTKLTLDPQEAFMSVDNEDRVSLSYPYVVFHEGIYKMWYGSTIEWQTENGEMLHVIKYATSSDGLIWEKHGVAIPYELGVAQAFSRPTVLIDESGYNMWYSFRSGNGTKYRIGYSFSKDGIHWENKIDEVGIDVSLSGWDNEMICYPFVFDHNGERYMLYNGNGYGKAGFGMAKLIKQK